MSKIVLVLLLLTGLHQEVASQPRKTNRQRQGEQAQPQPSPTVNQAQAEVNDAAKAESERYRKERDAKEDEFKSEQIFQNHVIAVSTMLMAGFAALGFIVSFVYAFFAYQTLKAVDRQAKHAGEQVGKMQAQLRTMRNQAIAAIAQARFAKEVLNETRSLVTQNADMVKTMQGQLDVMRQEAEAAVLSAETAQRGLRHTERQVELMIQSERAYIGIRRVVPIGLDGKADLAVKITFRNGGRSAAWGFRAFAHVEVGDSPRDFKWTEVASPVRRSFIPAMEDRTVQTPCSGFADIGDIINGTKFLFVDGEARYFTLGSDERFLRFGVTWNDPENEFEVRYQLEGESVTPEPARLKLTTFAPELVSRPAPRKEAEVENKYDSEGEDEGKKPS